MVDSWRIVKVEGAVGRRAAHDVSVVTAEAKGVMIKRGDVIKSSDVNAFKEAGHDFIAVLDPEEQLIDVVWEDEAVVELAKAVAGDGCEVKYTGEGKAFLFAEREGALRINEESLKRINLATDFRLTTRREDSWVCKGDVVTIVDLIPLHLTRKDLQKAVAGSERTVKVAQSHGLTAGLIITGTEVYEGRIKDLAEERVRVKLETYGCRLTDKVIVPDDEATISRAVSDMVSSHDLVVVTGGMSVDPTDITPRAILATGAKLVMYGLPVKPTTMSLLAYLNGKPVIGVSSGIIYFASENALDVLLPRICTGESWSNEELAALGNGGIMESFLDDLAKRGITHHGCSPLERDTPKLN
jgi:hypothetical protein